MTVQGTPAFQPYLPRLAVAWSDERLDVGYRVLQGSLVSLDISGFTSLSERLQARGRAGAEELILLISGIFEGLIGIAERRGGDVLKFRGDALLILFYGPEHERRACHAAGEMQWLIEQTGETVSSVGAVRLRMSCGIYSGDCHFFVVGSTHRELVVTGPGASATVALESGAEAGEILVSAATADALPPAWLLDERDDGHLISVATTSKDDPDPEPPQRAESGDALADFVPAPLRAQLALALGEGEHRHVTAAFVRFGGVDGLLASDGVEAVQARLASLGDLVGDVAAELGVTWLESDIDVDGGKLYLVAGAPAATGDEEERMLRALRRIVDADVGLELRAGVNRGPVFAGDIGAASRRTYAVMGDTVNLAARLTARAEPGGILASADVLDRARTRFETTHQPFLMKGKERPVTAYSVGAAAGVREETALRPVPLLGRERELDLVRDALNRASMRQTTVLEIVGEPGIGKSRLVEELRGLAVGFQQLSAQAQAYESSNPYFSFRSLLRPLAGITLDQSAAEAGARLAPWVQAVMPDLAPWLPLLGIPFDAEVPPTPEAEAIEPQFRRDKVHEVVDQFKTRTLLMPTLLVFEDAHWMDDASSFLLRHLLASPLPRPWLVVITRRPDGASFSEEPLLLEPLSAEAAGELALAASDEAALSPAQLEAVTERAGGNPLFVRELVEALRETDSVDTLPETVENLVTSRIDRLDPADRLLLRYASVVGPTFDLDLVTEIFAGEGIEAGDLDRWDRLAEFVEWRTGETLGFRHDLVRAMAYAGLSFRRRREIHGRVAEALERRAGDVAEEAAGLLSLHFAAAERHEPAWRYAVEAGRAAQSVYANVVAAELYERALAAAEHLPDLPREEIAAVWESLGDVTELFARYDRAEEAYASALALFEGSTADVTRLMWKSGVIRERAASYDEALDWYRRALAAYDEAGSEDEAGRVELELAYAGVRYRQGDFEECVEWSSRAADRAERIGDRRGLAHASYLLDIAYTRLGRADWSHRKRALAIYREIGDLVGHATVLNNLGTAAYHEYRWDQALEHYRESAELSKRAGDVSSVARVQLNESELLSDRGQLDEAEERLQGALRVWRAANYRLGVALATSNLGRAAARGGRFDEAQRLLAEALEQMEALGVAAFCLDTRARIAEAHLLAGEHAAAHEKATAVLADEGIAAQPALHALAERIAGYALVQARRPEDARPHFERSLELARAADALFEVALTLKAMADTGNPRAAELEAESRATLERLGVVSVPRVPLP